MSGPDALQNYGRFSGKADRELGTRVIDGKKAFGFQIDLRKLNPDAMKGLAEIWLDAESDLPVFVRYEMRWHTEVVTQIDKDIQWNIDLDPKLFDPTPPPGYAEDRAKPLALREQTRRIAEAMKIYAEASGGRYPPQKRISLRATDDLCDYLGLAKWPKRNAKDGNAGKAARAMDGFHQIADIQANRPEFAYYGKSVGPSDKDKVLLRWKLDDGRYEVLFGDLRSQTVTAQQLRKLEAK